MPSGNSSSLSLLCPFSVTSLSAVQTCDRVRASKSVRNLLRRYNNSATRYEQRGITGIFVEIRGNKIRKFSRSMEKVQFLFHSAHQATTKKNSRFTLYSPESSRSPNRPLSVRKNAFFASFQKVNVKRQKMI